MNLPKEAAKLGYLLDYKGKDINATISPSPILGREIISIEVNLESMGLKPSCTPS